ncbi:hypothetical protein [Actinopolymorpha sp. B9G3]|uniref:sialidase family protein n=1 Tax=Actinopolymorpha sp. B9G3 TaxID=3158970 RepID=UPI0032D9714F
MDPLEHRLREGLRGDRWGLSPDVDVLDRVHAGAARRRKRRKAVMAAGAVTAVIAAFGGIGYVATGGGPTIMVADGASSGAGAPAEKSAPDATDMDSDDRGAESAPGRDGDSDRRREERADQSPGSEPEQPNVLSEIAPVPGDFSPVSITATGPETYWLLGTTDGDRAALAATQDGGSTFISLASPPSAVARGDNEVSASTVSDVRFAGDGRTGWAYGGALWVTRDAGRTWEQDRSVPGLVKRLEVGGGSAYALVDNGSGWTLWRALLGEGTWQQLGVEAQAPEDLAVTGQLVAVTDKDADGTSVWASTDDGTTFETHPTPCHQDLDAGRLSATIGSLWLRCATGTGTTLHVSTDSGASWTDVPAGEPAAPATASALGARDAGRAIVAVPGEARNIGTDDTSTTPVPGLGRPAFAGFTTEEIGYILDLEGHLFRTDDGGARWSPVSIR